MCDLQEGFSLLEDEKNGEPSDERPPVNGAGDIGAKGWGRFVSAPQMSYSVGGLSCGLPMIRTVTIAWGLTHTLNE